MEQFMTWFGAVVMVMGIACVVVGHSVSAFKWLKYRIDKYIKEVSHGS